MSILAAFKSGNGTNQPANDSVPRLEEPVGLNPKMPRRSHGPWYGAVTRPLRKPMQRQPNKLIAWYCPKMIDGLPDLT